MSYNRTRSRPKSKIDLAISYYRVLSILEIKEFAPRKYNLMKGESKVVCLFVCLFKNHAKKT